MQAANLIFCCLKIRRINYIKFYYPLVLLIFLIYSLLEIMVLVVFKKLLESNVIVIFTLCYHLVFLVVTFIFYIIFLVRKNENYDYQKREIRKLSFWLIIGFGVGLALLLIIITDFAIKVFEIDSYTSYYNNKDVIISEYKYFELF